MAQAAASSVAAIAGEIPSGVGLGEGTPLPSFPPYPPYATEPVPPSVADTIIAGRELRVKLKSQAPTQSVRPPPKPARPRGPKATDVKLKRRAARAHARCLRRHNAVLTDRLEYIAKPQRRAIIHLWREYAHVLPADTIARLRSMLDADEPFKPEQAYEYFINMKKTKKRNNAMKVKRLERALSMCGDRRLVWARNATVALARGIQRRLATPGRYALADGMLRLSNIILGEMCASLRIRAPSRRCTHPKARFMMEMADKIAIWIDEILEDSEDRMLMMDFDEDEDVMNAPQRLGAGDILNGPEPAYLNLTGEMREVFLILTDAMSWKGDQPLLSHGKCQKTYREGADELRRTSDLEASVFDPLLAEQLSKDLADTAAPNTPNDLVPFMKEMVDLCAKYLAQYAEFNKDKGPAFRLLIKEMHKKGNEQLYEKENAKRTYAEAATELEESKGLQCYHDDPSLTQEIHAALTQIVDNVTPDDLQNDMKETVDISSKYLSQQAIHENLNAKALGTEGYTEGSRLHSNLSPEEIKKRQEEDRRRQEEKQNIKDHRRIGEEISGMRHYDGIEDATNLTPEEIERRKQKEEVRRREEERKMEEDRIRLEGGKLSNSKFPSRSGISTGSSLSFDVAESDASRKDGGKASTVDFGSEYDPEREQALSILHAQLRAKGADTLHQQPHTLLTHAQASEWEVLAMKPPMRVDKTVKESGDTSRLHKKLERKLQALVHRSTPGHMADTMQDVVIESARILAEYFVSKDYKALVKEGLIAEMQRRGNEILIEDCGETETYFYAAQRLKKTSSYETKEPCDEISYVLSKKLDDMMRCRPMARKLTATMKDHIKEASDYLSEVVTKPDSEIDAYVALLDEMEAAGDTPLIDGDIRKSFKDSAAYLRQLTSFEDQIGRTNSSLQGTVVSKMKGIMKNVPLRGYTASVMDSVIADSAKLLVSYIMLQGEKTEALKLLVAKLAEAGDAVLLRHGAVRKTCRDGADRLCGKTAEQLSVPCAEPVVTRKLHVKLASMLASCTPDKFRNIMDDVIEEATKYLAVHLLQPRVIQVCKCVKSVFVQCELWCDDILRRVARPYCPCSRHGSVHTFVQPPVQPPHQVVQPPHQVMQPVTNNLRPESDIARSHVQPPTDEKSLANYVQPLSHTVPSHVQPSNEVVQSVTDYVSPRDVVQKHVLSTDNIGIDMFENCPGSRMLRYDAGMDVSFKRCPKCSSKGSAECPADNPTPGCSRHYTTYMMHTVYRGHSPTVSPSLQSPRSPSPPDSPRRAGSPSRHASPARNSYTTRTPIVSRQAGECRAAAASVAWNVLAWRHWIQEVMDRVMQHGDYTAGGEGEWRRWSERVTREAAQWRRYHAATTVDTHPDQQAACAGGAMDAGAACALRTTHVLNGWTRWLVAIIKETNSLQYSPESDRPMHELRWEHLKQKMLEHSEDWRKYSRHLKTCCEHKYKTLLADGVCGGGVWVWGAHGAAAGGAVCAGRSGDELLWLARAVHKDSVVPGALIPSKQCCVVYTDGKEHHYTKYQVLCNVCARWEWVRAGGACARAVRVSARVLAGRVLHRGRHLVGAVTGPDYRCHVVIFGRPFDFDCYELLVLADDQ